MQTYEIKTVQKVTKREIDELVADSFNAIAYWCSEIRVIRKNGKEFEGPMNEALTMGHQINLYDAEIEQWERLTLKKLLKALGEVHFNFDDYDGSDVDIAIQTALFGEVVYG